MKKMILGFVCVAAFAYEATGQSVLQQIVNGGHDLIANGGREADHTLKGGAQAMGAVATAANQTVNNVVNTGLKAISDTSNTLNKAGSDISNTVNKAGSDVSNTVNKAGSDTSSALAKATDDLKKTLEKTGQDASLNLRLSTRDCIDATSALDRFAEAEIEAQGTVLNDAERRISEGKVVDAIWSISTDEFHEEDENAAAAVQQSALLNTVAQTAAGAYGGPAGAAAYAAWYTYNQTKDPDTALRAAMIVGATSWAQSAVGLQQGGTVSSEARKAIVAGAIGGVAVAAAGGNEAAIRDGFIKSGSIVLVQDYYQSVTGTRPNGRVGQASEGNAYVLTADGDPDKFPDDAFIRDKDGNILKNPDGSPKIDVSKLDPMRPHAGVQVEKGQSGIQYENSPEMTAVSKIPGMNAMALLHDGICVSWDLGSSATVATIPPAIVVTYFGTGAPFLEYLTETTISARKKDTNKSTQFVDGGSGVRVSESAAKTVAALEEGSLNVDWPNFRTLVARKVIPRHDNYSHLDFYFMAASNVLTCEAEAQQQKHGSVEEAGYLKNAQLWRQYGGWPEGAASPWAHYKDEFQNACEIIDMGKVAAETFAAKKVISRSDRKELKAILERLQREDFCFQQFARLVNGEPGAKLGITEELFDDTIHLDPGVDMGELAALLLRN